MSNENLDNDALATEEMLKMFEGIELDETQDLDKALDNDDALETLPENDEAVADALEMLETLDEFEELPEIAPDNMADAEILEMAELDDADPMLEALDAMETPDELDGLAFDENDKTTADSNDLLPIETVVEETLTEEAMVEEAVTDNTAMLPISQAPQAASVNASDEAPIAEHLQAVVANAIQALQDWMQLRQAGENKGPQQSLAQLDVLLDTVTHQQQHLAEQLANSTHSQVAQVAKALGVELATPQTLGWTADEWRVKAQQVAEKTDDISQRNAHIRQELARL